MNAEQVYVCTECGLHYSDEQVARQCAAWCSEQQSCNIAITKLAIELQPKNNS